MEEDEEDMYAPEYDPETEPVLATEVPVVKNEIMKEEETEKNEEGQEADEEEEEDDDSASPL